MDLKAWALVVVGIVGAVSGSQGSDRTGVTATCKALRSLPVTEEYSHGVVPPQAIPLLKDLKAELRELIASIVNTRTLGPDTSRQVRERIVSALKERGVIVGAQPDLNMELGYGYVVDISTAMPTQHADLLAVTVTLSIPCGNDTSLYLFRHSDERWNMILVDEVTGYFEISGARGQFKFQVSPPAADGSFMVLSASVPPWCTSMWHPLQYRLQKLTSRQAPPALLLSAEVALIAQDEGYELQAIQGGFALVYSVLDDANADRIRETLELTVQNGKVNSRRSRGE